MDSDEVSTWFGEYLEAFAACGRGERETASLLDYYSVPWLVTTDGGAFAPGSAEAVVAAVQPQIDGMRAAGFCRNELVSGEITVLNATSASYLATISRQRGDGTEISRLTATYLITDGAAGRRISVLAVHST